MSGHSKWSTIKRAKGVADAKRSQIFTKLANAITIAARQGPDPASNFKLRLVIEKAREVSMPKDNIERAIKRGAGNEAGSAKLEELTYEGYGPGGVAFLIRTLTDNRNRTGANIRHLLERYGGHLAESGGVAWMFSTKGLFQIALPIENLESLEMTLIEAGASDIKEVDNHVLILCEPNNFETLKKIITDNNLTPVYAAVEPVANTLVTADTVDTTNQLNQLREALDNDDNVDDFYDTAA